MRQPNTVQCPFCNYLFTESRSSLMDKIDDTNFCLSENIVRPTEFECPQCHSKFISDVTFKHNEFYMSNEHEHLLDSDTILPAYDVIEIKWNDCHHEGYTYRICVAKGTSNDKIEELVRKTIFNLMVLHINYYKVSNGY